MTAGVANKLGIGYADCKAREPRRRLLQHVGVRPRGSARALRRPRPAVPGGGRARVRGRRDAHRQRAALLPLRDVRRGQRDALGRRRASPRCTTSAAPARARSCGRRCSTAARCSRPTRCSSTARRSPRPRLDQGLHGIDACYRLYETQDGWIQIAAVKESEWVALCGALGVPELADDERFAVADLRREHRDAARDAARAALPRRRPSVVVDARARRRRRAERGPASTRTAGDLVLYDADNVRLGLVAEYEHPMMGHAAPVRRADPVLRHAGARARRRRRSSASTPARSSSGSATTPPRSTRCTPTTSSTGPRPTTPGRSDARSAPGQPTGSSGSSGSSSQIPIEQEHRGLVALGVDDRVRRGRREPAEERGVVVVEAVRRGSRSG